MYPKYYTCTVLGTFARSPGYTITFSAADSEFHWPENDSINWLKGIRDFYLSVMFDGHWTIRYFSEVEISTGFNLAVAKIKSTRIKVIIDQLIFVCTSKMNIVE